MYRLVKLSAVVPVSATVMLEDAKDDLEAKDRAIGMQSLLDWEIDDVKQIEIVESNVLVIEDPSVLTTNFVLADTAQVLQRLLSKKEVSPTEMKGVLQNIIDNHKVAADLNRAAYVSGDAGDQVFANVRAVGLRPLQKVQLEPGVLPTPNEIMGSVGETRASLEKAMESYEEKKKEEGEDQ